MKYIIQKLLFGLAIAAWISGCGTEVSGDLDDDADAGSADFSTYVAIGDSLTAGYKDGSLYRDGQLNSFPSILAQQFALAGGGAFTQPLMPVSATGSLLIAGNPPLKSNGLDPATNDRLLLVPSGNPERPAVPGPITPSIPTEIFPAIVPRLVGPFNNLGVPGAKSFHALFAGYGDPAGLTAVPTPTANPFFVRFASADGASILGDALAQVPTFFTLWLGNNDVLLYAVDGGDPTVGGEAITDPAVFTPAYNALAASLAAATPATKGVLVNVPDVRSIPYFTTVPYNAIPLNATQAADANAGFNLYNLGMQIIAAGGQCTTITPEEVAQRTITFSEGPNNPIVILDEDLTDLTCFAPQLIKMRQATPEDFIVLPAAAKLGTEQVPGDRTTTWGVGNPLLDRDVLTANEAAEVEVARSAYNVTIKAAADVLPNVAFFDAAAFLDELNTTGISYGSGGVSSTFAQGGAFSLDGIHPTARGYAVVANEIMQVIEDAFGAQLPPVNPSDYSTVFYQ